MFQAVYKMQCREIDGESPGKIIIATFTDPSSDNNHGCVEIKPPKDCKAFTVYKDDLKRLLDNLEK